MNKINPLISIVIPTFNQSEMLDFLFNQHIKLFKKLISHAFSTSTAASRADVKVRNVFYIEHSDVLGNSKLETKLANATKPVVKEGVENPTSIDDYVFPTLVDIQKIMGKTKVVDLCD